MQNKYFKTEGFRLSAIYTAVFALSLVAIGALVLVTTRHALLDQTLVSARTEITALQRAYGAEGLPEVLEVLDQLKGTAGDVELYLLQRDGKRIAGNLPAMAPRQGVVTLSDEGQNRVLGVGAELAPGLYAFSGSRLSRVNAVQDQLLHLLFWIFAVGLVLAALGGVLISRSFLSRTDAMATACRTIMDGDLKTRLPVRGSGDELDRLAAAVNQMLDRIAVLVENLGQVTNDIAHDLRTPVTHLRQRLEDGRSAAVDLNSQASFETAIEKTDEILAMFSALLRIAQIEGGSRRAAFAAVDLGRLLEQLRDIFLAVAEASNHALTLDIRADATVHGDSALLLQLFSNLIENAIIHTPEGTHIVLTLTKSGSSKIVASVADDGPGVPHDEQENLFRRLYRRETSRTTPGYGLGLAVAAAIAELHGAKAEIEPVTRGFTVQVVFESQ